MKFFTSNHCRSNEHCEKCRDIVNKNFRKSIVEVFDDVDEVDFECPFGKFWGYKHEKRYMKQNEKKRNNRKNRKKILNGYYIYNNKDVFTDINGFNDAYENRLKKINNHESCTSCVINKVFKDMVKFITQEIENNKRLDILKKMDKNVVFTLTEGQKTVHELIKEFDSE